jgi:hypothetical protein
VCHIRSVLAEILPVLRNDGCLWLNIGDSYSGSGKGPTGWSGIGNQQLRQGFVDAQQARQQAARTETPQQHSARAIRRKSLIGIPERVVLAAQANGWIVRSRIPWLKHTAMPESATDRPATSVEYVLLLAKQEHVFWDAVAVRMADRRRALLQEPEPPGGVLSPHIGISTSGGRNRRTSDWFFESWQGLMLDDQGEPLALVVNPQPFSGAHFAMFSPKLVERMIQASTSERGCCPECGAPLGSVTWSAPSNPRQTFEITANFTRAATASIPATDGVSCREALSTCKGWSGCPLADMTANPCHARSWTRSPGCARHCLPRRALGATAPASRWAVATPKWGGTACSLKRPCLLRSRSSDLGRRHRLPHDEWHSDGLEAAGPPSLPPIWPIGRRSCSS